MTRAADTTSRTPAALALPFIVALVPVAYLWSANAVLVRAEAVLVPALAVIVGTAISLAVLILLTRQPARSALAIAVTAIPVLTFGSQADLIPPDAPEIATWLLLVANVGLTIAAAGWLWQRDPARFAVPMAAIAGITLCLSVPGIVAGLPSRDITHREAVDGGAGPDIYYIVLDAYAREDVLLEVYGHDNSDFLGKLEQRGFFVAEEASATTR